MPKPNAGQGSSDGRRLSPDSIIDRNGHRLVVAYDADGGRHELAPMQALSEFGADRLLAIASKQPKEST
jgi:hypothetical protein